MKYSILYSSLRDETFAQTTLMAVLVVSITRLRGSTGEGIMIAFRSTVSSDTVTLFCYLLRSCDIYRYDKLGQEDFSSFHAAIRRMLRNNLRGESCGIAYSQNCCCPCRPTTRRNIVGPLIQEVRLSMCAREEVC
ncbi:unnamed protein product [Cylicocyclus nassatus]|uniref:Uncharacterized protein n=1 Tax=Cylicocyclus nassatus TaxID=53992 RepID=A0AA36H7B1_CYLNA|nr:unnamed protein product [Cylicocyclus nassatus]